MNAKASEGWAVIEVDEGVHVFPIGDKRRHIMSLECWCRPRLDKEDPVIVHNSMDGREFHERGKELLQ